MRPGVAQHLGDLLLGRGGWARVTAARPPTSADQEPAASQDASALVALALERLERVRDAVGEPGHGLRGLRTASETARTARVDLVRGVDGASR